MISVTRFFQTDERISILVASLSNSTKPHFKISICHTTDLLSVKISSFYNFFLSPFSNLKAKKKKKEPQKKKQELS